MKHATLADLDRDDFTAALQHACRATLGPQTPGQALELTPASYRALHIHYQELRRWSPHLALIGPGTVAEVIDRHYAESLAVLPWIDALEPNALEPGALEPDALEIDSPSVDPQGRDTPTRLVDLGSGAGFPGWILAAARPGLEATLVESRARKGAFLESATRKAAHETGALPIHWLGARVGIPLPGGLPERFDLVTLRALKLEPKVLAALARRLNPKGRFFLWLGAETPPLPPELAEERELSLTGSERRRILELRRS